MYRSLSMYPKSVDPAQVEEMVRRSTAIFRQSPGFLTCSTSVDALMGPGAKDGTFARIVMVDFDTLESALGALKSESFEELHELSNRLEPVHYLFECVEA